MNSKWLNYITRRCKIETIIALISIAICIFLSDYKNILNANSISELSLLDKGIIALVVISVLSIYFAFTNILELSDYLDNKCDESETSININILKYIKRIVIKIMVQLVIAMMSYLYLATLITTGTRGTIIWIIFSETVVLFSSAMFGVADLYKLINLYTKYKLGDDKYEK